ncbi:MAG: DNA replication complex GINS family protein [Hadesarchaea archaeon]|nr:DNA replication complex GINS family protein [Candidatus Bipolaricaulota bacterium]MBC7218652.1 DNA replication complex GINS family protein [Hadesarchaea archaeon]
MINFSLEELVRIYLEEKSSRELIEIPDDFYQNVGRHVSRLNSELGRSDGVRGELLREELWSVVFMVQEIYFTRLVKAMAAVVRGQAPAPLIERERYAFTEIRQILEKLQAEILQQTISGKVEVTIPGRITNVLCIMLSDFREKIVGVDLKSYGPFAKGEIASLPAPNAEIMVKHGLARRITVKA